MTDAGFEKVVPSEKKLYGPRKLLLCGFPVQSQPKFKMLLEMMDSADLPLIWVAEHQSNEMISSLFALPDGSGEGIGSTLPRALIVGGINQQELHRLMSGCRQAGMRQALWAVLTPTSERWRLSNLLRELAAEHEAMARNTGKPSSSDT
jgi:hypothetical protein